MSQVHQVRHMQSASAQATAYPATTPGPNYYTAWAGLSTGAIPIGNDVGTSRCGIIQGWGGPAYCYAVPVGDPQGLLKNIPILVPAYRQQGCQKVESSWFATDPANLLSYVNFKPQDEFFTYGQDQRTLVSIDVTGKPPGTLLQVYVMPSALNWDLNNDCVAQPIVAGDDPPYWESSIIQYYIETTTTAPPAPIPAKASYHASLASSPVIPFTDTADASSGTLTWHYSIPSTLTPFVRNVKFTNPTTSSSPHATSLAFDLTSQVTPGNYTVSATVTSSTTGLTSSVGSFTLTVNPIAEAWYFSNPDGLYITNSAGTVLAQATTPLVTSVAEPQVVADFAPQVSNINLANAQRYTMSTNAPVLDPAGAQFLKDESFGGNPACVTTPEASNATNDPFDIINPTLVQFNVFCNDLLPPVITVIWDTSSIDFGHAPLSTMMQSLICWTINTKGLVKSCSTILQVFPFPAGKGSIMSLSTQISLPLAKLKREDVQFILNAKGIEYPQIKFDNGNDTTVPFPILTRPLANCPSADPGSAKCPNTVPRRFRTNIFSYYQQNGWTVPAGISIRRIGPLYQGHHILPLGCGGSDDVGNGVFLGSPPASLQHYVFTEWWKSVPPCAPNKVND